MSNANRAFNLNATYLRLRSDVTIEALNGDATFWPRLMSGQLGDFHNEFLVITTDYVEDWAFWEMHPAGDELVCLLAGAVVMILEQDGKPVATSLEAPGEFVLVPKGTWHTAKVSASCRMLFITAGEGTQHRPLA